MTLLVQPMLHVPVAAQVTLVRAGFLDEPDDIVGMSHVLEHMLFKGTPTLAPGELARQTKALGGDLNAWTSYDRTVYYATMPASAARAIGRLQADQVQSPLLDADELRRELGVIVQEVRRKRDSPGAMASETVHRLLYGEHRIRRWRIGEEEALERFTAAQVRDYYHSRYRPERTVVAWVGQGDPAGVLDALRADWANWQPDAAAPIPPGPVERSQPIGQVATLARDVTRADLVLGWRAPPATAASVAALELAAGVLTLGRGGQLQRQLRDRGLVGGVGAAHYGAGDVGVWVLGADGDPEHLPEILAGMGGALHALRERALPREELTRVCTLLQARWHRMQERVESRALALVDAEMRDEAMQLDGHPDRWTAVTPEALRETVREWLPPQAVAGVVCRPLSSTLTLTAEGVQRHLAQPPVWHNESAPPIVPRAARPLPRPTQRAGAHHLALGGVDILTARFGSIPQVALGWYGPPPPAATDATAGHQALLLRSLLRGTMDRNTTVLAMSAERLGGSMGVLHSHDVAGLSLTVLEAEAAAAASLLAEVLRAPRLADADVAIERELLREDARAVADDMVRFPLQLMAAAAFPGHPYGQPLHGTDESLTECDPAALRLLHAAWLGAGRSTLVAVGPGDPAALAEALATAVGDWPAPSGVSVDPSMPVLRAAVQDVERIREQSALAMLMPGPSRRDPRRSAAEVWAALAGGLGGVLFEALRSQRSLAYTVLASSWQRRHGGGLLTYIATAPERLAEAREAMQDELHAMAAMPPSPADLERARQALIGQAEVARQTAGAVAGALCDAWWYGEDLAVLADPGARYREVTAAAVQEILVEALAGPGPAQGVVRAAEGALRSS